MKGKTISKRARIGFAELEKQLSSIDSEIEQLGLVKATKEKAIQDYRPIKEEIKQLGKRPKLSFGQLLNQAYEYLKRGEVKKASEIYAELEKIYLELAKALKKR